MLLTLRAALRAFQMPQNPSPLQQLPFNVAYS